MTSTYKAVEVSAPGTLRVVERQVSEPATGQVRIRVEACGICHTDAATVTGNYPGLKLPRVPGHEVVGRIEALGIWVSSLRGRWDSILLRSDADPRRRSLRKIWARTSTSIVPARMPQRCCSVWAGPERFWQQEPVVMPWGHLWPVLQHGAS